MLVRGRIGSLFEWAWGGTRLRRPVHRLLRSGPTWLNGLLDRAPKPCAAQPACRSSAGIDVLGINDDIAMQTGPMMSLATWRRWFKPRWAKVLAAAKAIPSRSSWCGTTPTASVMAFVPDLIEIGVNISQPRPARMHGWRGHQAPVRRPSRLLGRPGHADDASFARRPM